MAPPSPPPHTLTNRWLHAPPQVWEETIIFMPKHARMVFLSATLPNAREFAEVRASAGAGRCCCCSSGARAEPPPLWLCTCAQWVAYVHSHPCHVVYTDYRPTPLMHYAFPAGGEGLYLVRRVCVCVLEQSIQGVPHSQRQHPRVASRAPRPSPHRARPAAGGRARHLSL